MAHEFEVNPTKTYATHANAVKAVEKLAGEISDLRYFITCTPGGRFFPVFVGVNAIKHGVHFHFNVVA